jgi:hypothetical protein
MPLAFLLDENLRGLLYRHVRRHNAMGEPPLDVVRVGDPPDLPRGSEDPDILRWAERHGRILISRDVNTMPRHLAEHLRAGGHTPGLFLLRPAPLPVVVGFLVLAAYASDPSEWEGRVEFVP